MLEGWKLLYIYCLINDNGYCQTHKPKWRRDEAEKHFVALYLKGLHRPCLVMYCSVPRHITYKPCTILNMYDIFYPTTSYLLYAILNHRPHRTTRYTCFFLWHYITPEVFRGLYIYTVRAMKRQTSIQNKPNVCLCIETYTTQTTFLVKKKVFLLPQGILNIIGKYCITILHSRAI